MYSSFTESDLYTPSTVVTSRDRADVEVDLVGLPERLVQGAPADDLGVVLQFGLISCIDRGGVDVLDRHHRLTASTTLK